MWFGRFSTTTFPDGTTKGYAFDSNGKVFDQNGTLRTHRNLPYDGLNRRKAKSPAGESAGQVSYGYDLAGRLLQADGFNMLAYDVENRLIQARNGAHGTSQYLYDPLGRRKQKVTGGVTTQFVLAGDQEIADFAVTGVGAAQILTVRGIGGLPVATVAPGNPETIVYYHHDVLGSSTAATASGQNGAEAFTYGEYGTPGAGNVVTYRFAGYRLDTETGLYFVQARYYSPNLGRFLHRSNWFAGWIESSWVRRKRSSEFNGPDWTLLKRLARSRYWLTTFVGRYVTIFLPNPGVLIPH